MSVYKLYTADKCYIGSTELTIKERLSLHKNSKNKCRSKLIMCESDWDWEVLETDIPLDQLRIRERYWFDTTENKVNKNRPAITKEERRTSIYEINKEYRLNNREKEKERHKKYKEKHRESIGSKNREYYEKNKESICAKKREDYQRNKEIISAKKKEKYKLAKERRANDKQDGVE